MFLFARDCYLYRNVQRHHTEQENRYEVPHEKTNQALPGNSHAIKSQANNKLARENEGYNTHTELLNGSVGHRYFKLSVAGESIRTMTFALKYKIMQSQ